MIKLGGNRCVYEHPCRLQTYELSDFSYMTKLIKSGLIDNIDMTSNAEIFVKYNSRLIQIHSNLDWPDYTECQKIISLQINWRHQAKKQFAKSAFPFIS